MDPNDPPPPPAPPRDPSERPRLGPQVVQRRRTPQFSLRTLLVITTAVAVLLGLAPLFGWSWAATLFIALQTLQVALVVLLLQGAIYAPRTPRQFCRGALVGLLLLFLQDFSPGPSLLWIVLPLVIYPLVGGLSALLAERIWPTSPPGPPLPGSQPPQDLGEH